ncbi:MAP kinase-activated protein kinase 2 [Platysternon megacephalum]|uniref:MAP kinase-activated protein kinase 2 n=1 Tax=Platysternon megacephalum TaxID=55544 RepID=A0A4D9DV98_9SAUR|nr:MAP kinase-activated protein kinase 2 [Platysternon megacephalum]
MDARETGDPVEYAEHPQHHRPLAIRWRLIHQGIPSTLKHTGPLDEIWRAQAQTQPAKRPVRAGATGLGPGVNPLCSGDQYRAMALQWSGADYTSRGSWPISGLAESREVGMAGGS